MCKTRYEVARQYAPLLRELATAGVSVDDWRSVAIYEEVMRLRRDGLKMEYCVTYVSSVFAISEARVWRTIRRMRTKI